MDHRIHTWLREHIYQRPSVDDVARAMGLTRSHLSRVYSINRQSGLGELIRHLIIEQIEHELLDGASAEEIAYRFGLNSTRRMAQFISRSTGITWQKWLTTIK